jgi:hypothetical protein
MDLAIGTSTYCGTCGFQSIIASQKFCSNCGNRISSSSITKPLLSADQSDCLLTPPPVASCNNPEDIIVRRPHTLPGQPRRELFQSNPVDELQRMNRDLTHMTKQYNSQGGSPPGAIAVVPRPSSSSSSSSDRVIVNISRDHHQPSSSSSVNNSSSRLSTETSSAIMHPSSTTTNRPAAQYEPPWAPARYCCQFVGCRYEALYKCINCPVIMCKVHTEFTNNASQSIVCKKCHAKLHGEGLIRIVFILFILAVITITLLACRNHF